MAGDGSGKLVGVISRRHLLDAYQAELMKRDVVSELGGSLAGAATEEIHLGKDFRMCEIEAPGEFVDRSIRDLDVRASWGAEILLLRRPSPDGDPAGRDRARGRHVGAPGRPPGGAGAGARAQAPAGAVSAEFLNPPGQSPRSSTLPGVQHPVREAGELVGGGDRFQLRSGGARTRGPNRRSSSPSTHGTACPPAGPSPSLARGLSPARPFFIPLASTFSS